MFWNFFWFKGQFVDLSFPLRVKGLVIYQSITGWGGQRPSPHSSIQWVCLLTQAWCTMYNRDTMDYMGHALAYYAHRILPGSMTQCENLDSQIHLIYDINFAWLIKSGFVKCCNIWRLIRVVPPTTSDLDAHHFRTDGCRNM